MPSSNERSGTVTSNDAIDVYTTIDTLSSPDWNTVLDGLANAKLWLRSAPIGDAGVGALETKFRELSGHSKWEVRREVALLSVHFRDHSFQAVIAKLASDDNSRVQQAAVQAMAHRQDWVRGTSFQSQHEKHVNAKLDDIEGRYGVRARQAVRRLSEHITNTHIRELYHEISKMITPLGASASRLREALGRSGDTHPSIADEVSRLYDRLLRLQAVVDAMRAFAATPTIVFQSELLEDVVNEARSLVQDRATTEIPMVMVVAQQGATAMIDRTRFVQAITNLLQNAVEAYDGRAMSAPITIRVYTEDAVRAVISVEDGGCGMDDETLRDAPTLFSTSKTYGTGFGLPLVLKIVEHEHGGRVTLQSAPGQGTTVRLDVLLVQPSTEPDGDPA